MPIILIILLAVVALCEIDGALNGRVDKLVLRGEPLAQPQRHLGLRLRLDLCHATCRRCLATLVQTLSAQ